MKMKVCGMTKTTDVFETQFAYNIFKDRYSFGGKESWKELSERVVESVCGSYLPQNDKDIIKKYVYELKFIPAGRYLYAAGREAHMVKNCYGFRVDDNRESWADLLYKTTITSMLGGGCGTNYSNLRCKGTPIKRVGGVSSGPLSLMHAVNESARYIRQGGSRRAALLALLSWNHGDIFDFIHAKDWSDILLTAKSIDPSIPLPLELTNISVSYDTEFFNSIERGDKKAISVWDENCFQSFKTGEPGFAFDNIRDAFSLRNPCGEFVSDTDSDSCNLGTVFMSKFKDRDEFEHCIKYVTKFLVCGNLYSEYPTKEMKEIAIRNNRIGLGLGGVHEWLIDRDCEYRVTSELHKWLNIYERESNESAYIISKDLGINIPLDKRAIAPTGTIGALSESTTGIEPIFCKAYKRSYFKGDKKVYEYVVDPVIRKAIEKGKDISKIQDSYDISFKDRVKLQADIQQYVDMAISSTCNLPEWGSSTNNEETLGEYSKVLLKYAKRLRGFTTYPNNSRGGQPLERVSIEEAMSNQNKVFETNEKSCVGGVCGV
jgi:ribonucleoside-diphosphate reductase alpha chain